MTKLPFIVDSHCHLNYGNLSEDIDGVLARAKDVGIGTMLAINARLSEYEDVLAIAEAHDHIYATVGSHPHEADVERDVKAEDLIAMSKHKKIVGIGETGLDYYYDRAPRDRQQRNFIAHIEAARETGLPLIVHTRDADEDCGRIMEAEMKKSSLKSCEGIYKNHKKESATYDYAVPRLMSEYALNIKMVLALQQMGQGKTGAGILGGMFSVIPEGLKNQWTELEEAIAQYQIALGTTI